MISAYIESIEEAEDRLTDEEVLYFTRNDRQIMLAYDPSFKWEGESCFRYFDDREPGTSRPMTREIWDEYGLWEKKEWFEECRFPVVCRVSNDNQCDDTTAIITAYHEGFENPFESQYDTFWERAEPLEEKYFYQLQRK